MKSRIGIVGLGLVGSALASRLLSLNYKVSGYDVVSAAVDKNAHLGVVSVNTIAELAQQVDVVLICVLDDAALLSVSEALQVSTPGQLVISCVTSSAEAAIEVNRQCECKSIAFAEFPLLGSSEQIRRGEAKGLLGATTDTVIVWAAIFESLSPSYTHVGDVGLAAATKLACNLVLGLNRAALAEGMALAKALGIEAHDFLRSLIDSPAHSQVVKTAGLRMADRQFAPVSRVSQHRKDLALILEAAKSQGLDAALSKAHAGLLDKVISMGQGDLDNVAVLTAYDQKFESNSSAPNQKHVLVSGSSSGIGREICERLLRDGYKVTGIDRDAAVLVDENFTTVRLDLLDDQAVEAQIQRWKNDSFSAHAFVHAAGVMRGGSLGALDASAGYTMWKIHVQAATSIANYLVPVMRASGHGRIVLIGSRVASGMAGRSQYAATKSALVSLAKSWAAECVADGVTVNVISPAATRTAMISDPARQATSVNLPPMGRLIEPGEIAALTKYLLSSDAAAITGQDIQIDGGASLQS
jgi:3-oxoacyl-[acyl-carrier protein] reductase